MSGGHSCINIVTEASGRPVVYWDEAVLYRSTNAVEVWSKPEGGIYYVGIGTVLAYFIYSIYGADADPPGDDYVRTTLAARKLYAVYTLRTTPEERAAKLRKWK